jgi:hypothetical protein
MSGENDTYRLCVVMHAPLADPDDLTATLDWIVKSLSETDPLLFSLRGYSPAMQAVPVLDGEKSLVGGFVATSEIAWNFGREPADPTHEVVFFNAEEGARNVYLRASFVAGDAVSTGPGLVFELRLGRDAAGPSGPERVAHLDTLFSLLVPALNPDFGHVELPGHPASVERPATYEVGWLTYFAAAERPLPPEIRPPAVRVPMETGTKIFATPTLSLETHGDVAAEIASVRDQLAVHAMDEPPPPPPPEPLPTAAHAGFAGLPSYMSHPQPPEETIDEEHTSTTYQVPGAGAPLPFQPPPASAPLPPQRPSSPTMVFPKAPASAPLPFPEAPVPASGPGRSRFDATPFRPAEPEPDPKPGKK